VATDHILLVADEGKTGRPDDRILEVHPNYEIRS